MDNRLLTDPDFILLARYDNSLTKLLERYPDGAPAHIVAKALGLSEGDVERRYQGIVKEIQHTLGLQED